MDDVSDQFFSRSGFPENEDCCIGRGHLLGPVKDILEAITLPDYIFKLMFHFVLVTEVNILDLELFFHRLNFKKRGPQFNRPLLDLLLKLGMGFLQRLFLDPHCFIALLLCQVGNHHAHRAFYIRLPEFADGKQHRDGLFTSGFKGQFQLTVSLQALLKQTLK